MSSNPPPVASSSKASASSGPASPAQIQPGALNTVNFFGQQRGGSVATGASSRASPTPRNNQQGKKQNKGSKRFRQTDEDAIVESVSAKGRECRTSG
jgi:hypothetical protein